MLDSPRVDPASREHDKQTAATPPGAAYGSYGLAVSNLEEAHLTDYLRVLYKRRWVALVAFVLVIGTVTIKTTTTQPVYLARTQMLIGSEQQNVVLFKDVVDQNRAGDEYFHTQQKILLSRSLARRTLTALNLWNDPHFSGRPQATEAPKGLFQTTTESVKGVLRPIKHAIFAPPPAEPRALDETVLQSRIIDSFLGGLKIVPVRDSRLVDVAYESADPVFATRVSNGVAEQYVQQNFELNFQAVKGAADWLSLRLAEQRQQVESSELALQQYLEQNDASSLGDAQNIVVQKLTDLNGAVTRVKTERIQKEAVYRQVQALESNPGSVEAFPEYLASPFIQELRAELAGLHAQHAQLAERLGDRHPEMLKVTAAMTASESRLRAEIAKGVRSARAEYETAMAQEQSLTGLLESQKSEALKLNRKGIAYSVLERDAASNRTIFESLMQRMKETGITGELKTNNIRIVDAAEVPQAPIRPNTRNNMLLGLFGGLLLAVGVAFFFEYVDNRIKSPEEIKSVLGLPFLGMLPAVTNRHEGQLLINNAVPSHFGEACRVVRTNLLFSCPDAPEAMRTIVVSSAAPHEGKTVVATNLALALAQAGQRVLLVDADMRRPRVHSVFDLEQAPGLSNVLVGASSLADSVQPTEVSNLSVLPAGMLPPNPAELLESRRFKEVLAGFQGTFDWVVLDTPPVLAVTDASVIGHMASGVVFVVGSEMTSRQVAQAALEQFAAGRARVLGAVLNRIRLDRNAYYYAKYYKRVYGRYYGPAIS